MANSAESAMQLASQHPCDLILGELFMPFGEGHALLVALAAEPRLSNVPFVILSVRDREGDIVRGLEQGADDYVVKPFNARELLARIRKRIQPDRPRR